MSKCGSCSGDCGSCGGCARELVLTPAERELLELMAQIPFLPIARRADDPAPVYLEEGAHTPAEDSLILVCLEKKGLVSLDYDKPLRNFAYGDYPIRGSAALTERGQNVLELLQWQGATDEA